MASRSSLPRLGCEPAPPWQAMRPARLVQRLVVGLAGLLLAACGGGITFGFGGYFDNAPPSISLAASAGSVQAGQSLRLIAAAADENGIDAVIFFRFDAGEAVSLGSLDRPPYEISTVAPTDGRASMSVFARAVDNAGNRADSPLLTITIVR